MKEVPLSTCEKTSLWTALRLGLRLDKRKFLEVRDISLHFGKEYGSCTAVLGHTRVLAQVSCEVVEPRPSRPNEGKLSIAIHISPMAGPNFEAGRGSELADELQKILDRNIKESRCLDLESLCILAEESVWQFKVDVTVLNHDGNLGDCCNIAAVAALRHFHRPDVSVEEDGRVTVYTLSEREPLETFLKKVPVCLTYAFFMENDECFILMDPSLLEERVMSGKLVVGLNPHGEITSLMFPGRVSLKKRHIMKCVSNAFIKAKTSAEMIQRLVDDDLKKRKTVVKPNGYLNSLTSDAKYTFNHLQKIIHTEQKLDISNFLREARMDTDNIKDAEMENSDDELQKENIPHQNMEDEAQFHEVEDNGSNHSPISKHTNDKNLKAKNAQKNPRKISSDSEEEPHGIDSFLKEFRMNVNVNKEKSSLTMSDSDEDPHKRSIPNLTVKKTGKSQKKQKKLPKKILPTTISDNDEEEVSQTLKSTDF